ncbi:hypothetical protein NECAME_11721 [Necator americanus]|uniref:Uncharacterized protein n=1 Tax=Necator americanus TaxID=51031 RepID=W2T306_NECAM|nr:hypothetical protein NECAME_11721 [Necator americanus]ETN76390.1 hypothetical protein NECAME_11721 [Necator americanus]
MSGLKTSEDSVISGNPLSRRHGRSCDLQAANEEDKPDKYDNPIAQHHPNLLSRKEDAYAARNSP